MNRETAVDVGTPGACRASEAFDPSVPNVARVYDYVLGGKDNFAADRAFADEGIRWVPDFPLVVRANREFLGRAVRHLAADCGIDQFLDIGTGLPTAENVHQVVHRVNPAGRVVYVDNDKVVLTHARALLADSGNVGVAEADLRHPEGILTAPQVRQLIDFERPVAVLMVAILHFVTDEHRPQEIVRRFHEAIAPGSYLALSHAEYRARLARPASMYRRMANEPAVLRPREEIARFFDGFDLLEPGLVPVSCWRPGTQAPGKVRSAALCADGSIDAEWPGADQVWLAAGVGRKPNGPARPAAAPPGR
jgi:hypothetical protein